MQSLDLVKINQTSGTQSRNEINLATVADYAEAMRDGAKFPAVVVFYAATEDIYYLADGFHRIQAAATLGYLDILADVRDGDRRDAILYSVGSNSDHGLRRTNADKRKAVTTLLQDTEWSRWSDHEIAKVCCVSHPFVGKIRSSLVTVTSDTPPERTYTTKHGTQATMNTANIGHTEPEPEADPVADLWEQAEQQENKKAVERTSEIRAAVRDERRQERVKKIQEISENNQELSTDIGKFPVIYADPPWRYEHAESESRAIENQYPTMSLDEICALPVGDIATDDCILFMWTTSPKLAESMQVLDSWGFDYRTCMVWVKDKIGMGYYARQQHELLLIAKQGNPVTPEPGNRPPSVVNAPRIGHSKKPEKFYEIIEGMYPEFKKIELFCRTPRNGWSVWGNQSSDS